MSDHSDIKAQIQAVIASLADKSPDSISSETQLIGGDGLLDSMKLVELCLYLEDMASELGFDFDWTSETAMSQSRGMFRSVGSLTEQFISQLEGQA